MEDRLIIVDGYNLILRSPRLKPGPTRTLRESRGMLLNMLAWMMGGNNARFVVVFDGAEDGVHAEQGTPRVEIRWSRPPEKADDVIRHLVEKRVGGDEQVTVVTSDIEVARHARAMGADVSLADLFLASALGVASNTGESTGGEEGDEAGDAEKPTSLSKQELKDWAEIFTRRSKAAAEPGEEPDH